MAEHATCGGALGVRNQRGQCMNALKTVFAILMGLVMASAAGAGAAVAGEEGGRPAISEGAPETGLRLRWDHQQRFRYTRLTDFALEEEGTLHGRAGYGEHRLRLAPSLRWGAVELLLEADLVSGQLFGDASAVGAAWLDHPHDQSLSAEWFAPRQAVLRWRSPGGLLILGQTASRWGLGMVANDGAGDDEDLFSDPRRGDLVERAMFVTAPLAWGMDASWARKLRLGLGADLVFADDNARLLDGDVAFQAVGSLFWDSEPLFAGVYVAWRHQDDDDGDEVRVTALDGFVRWTPHPSSRWLRPSLEGELAWLTGTSDRAWSEWTGGALDVRALGFLGRARLDLPPLDLGLRLDLGYASGDQNRADGTTRVFSMDPNVHAGMILFEEVLAWTSARGAERAADPTRLATPAKGIDQIPSEGRVHNSFFLNPTFRYQPGWGLDAAVGYLAAIAPAGLQDPLNSARLGGYGATPFGQEADTWGYLGSEIDLGLRYRRRLLRERLVIGVGVQGGVFLPSAAFEGEGGVEMGAVYKVRVLVDVGFSI
jgi:hypothetical protein